MNNKLVYMVEYNDDVLYVGCGDEGRPYHTTSGVSHVYELNKLHFLGITPKINILEEGLTKEQALVYEQYHIERLKPLYNKSHCVLSKDVNNIKSSSTVLPFIKAYINKSKDSGVLYIDSNEWLQYTKRSLGRSKRDLEKPRSKDRNTLNITNVVDNIQHVVNVKGGSRLYRIQYTEEFTNNPEKYLRFFK